MLYSRTLFLLALSANVLCAQTPTILQGRVFSASGNPVGGATVRISGSALAPVPTAVPSQAAGSAANPAGRAAGGQTSSQAPGAPGGPGRSAPPTAGQNLTGPAQTMAPSGPSTFVAITGSGSDSGRYSLSIPPGTYDFEVAFGSHRAQSHKGIAIGGPQQEMDFVLDATCDSCGEDGKQQSWNKTTLAFITFGLVLAFVVNIWFVRWNNIARPNRELLNAEIDKVEARFKSETGLDLEENSPDTGHLWRLLKSARDALASKNTFLDFIFWSRGREMTAWSRIYEFQRDSIKLITPASLPLIRSRLQAISLDLADIDKAHAKAFVDSIHDLLDKQSNDEPALRAMLVEALTYLNDEYDSSFGQLVAWQTKAVWLVGVGGTLIAVLAFAVGNAVLFIAGATGGYLSRLARQLKRADVPSDYGASWTTLFLSPIVGALSGWFGILLVVLLANSNLAVLGAAFQQIEWCCPLAPLTLGLAFAFGFSERLFDGIISSLEDKVDKDRQAATQPKQPGPAPSGAAGAGGAGVGVGAAVSSVPKNATTSGVVPATDPNTPPKKE